VVLVEKSEPFVEALAVRNAKGAGFAQPPFADCGGSISGLLEHLGNSNVIGTQRDAPAAPRCVGTDPAMAGMTSGHETAAGRGAYGSASVSLGKPDPFRRHTVDVRGCKALLPEAAEVAVPKVVGENKNDVRGRKGRRQKRSCRRRV
jgi:hypothetical protein